VMFRDRRRNIRRIYQIGEFIPSEEAGKPTVKPNILYRWRPREDKIVKHVESLRLFEEIGSHTGMNQEEIVQDLKIKSEIVKVKKGKRRYDLLFMETPKGKLKFNLGKYWEDNSTLEKFVYN